MLRCSIHRQLCPQCNSEKLQKKLSLCEVNHNLQASEQFHTTECKCFVCFQKTCEESITVSNSSVPEAELQARPKKAAYLQLWSNLAYKTDSSFGVTFSFGVIVLFVLHVQTSWKAIFPCRTPSSSKHSPPRPKVSLLSNDEMPTLQFEQEK